MNKAVEEAARLRSGAEGYKKEIEDLKLTLARSEEENLAILEGEIARALDEYKLSPEFMEEVAEAGQPAIHSGYKLCKFVVLRFRPNFSFASFETADEALELLHSNSSDPLTEKEVEAQVVDTAPPSPPAQTVIEPVSVVGEAP